MGKKIYANDLGIDLSKYDEKPYFRWFLASLLFGKPIQQQVAVRAYCEFVKEGFDSPEAIIKAGWNKLVEVLDRGHYARYDYSTATKLLRVCQDLMNKYNGKVTNLILGAKDDEDLARQLDEFYGVGQTTARIFIQGLKKPKN